MEPPEEDNGSTEPAFFSSVVPDSATWVVSATCAGVVTVADGVPVRGRLNRPNWNISVRMRCTMVFSTLFAIVPFWTPVCSGVP